MLRGTETITKIIPSTPGHPNRVTSKTVDPIAVIGKAEAAKAVARRV